MTTFKDLKTGDKFTLADGTEVWLKLNAYCAITDSDRAMIDIDEEVKQEQ